jgi:hypothetical protein
MTASVTFNPFLQSVGNAGLFNIKTDGYRQGTAMPDPATMFRLRNGNLASSEVLPMWGGVAVYANVPGAASTPNTAYGMTVGRALSETDANKPIAGFSVFDQDYSMITSAQSTVPLAGSGMSVFWYPLGSLARIVVACDPGLTSLKGGPINAAVSWDFTNQLLIPDLGTLTVAATGSSYASATGIVTLNMSVPPTFSAGDSITVSGATGGGADLGKVNTTATVTSVVGNLVTYVIATGLTITSITGGNVVVGGAASSALSCKILDVVTSNCETVSYASSTGYATWNYNGAAALIQI